MSSTRVHEIMYRNGRGDTVTAWRFRDNGTWLEFLDTSDDVVFRVASDLVATVSVKAD